MLSIYTNHLGSIIYDSALIISNLNRQISRVYIRKRAGQERYLHVDNIEEDFQVIISAEEAKGLMTKLGLSLLQI